MDSIPLIRRIDKTLGSLKFAVILLGLFALFMIVGTFFESYYGTDFANRTIYKTWFFMLLQFGMFLSISFAAFQRLPPKKRLYGFYTIHTGLITIGAGSFITYYSGVDGSLLLPPNGPSREVILNEDVLKIRFPDEGRLVTYKLPYTGFSADIAREYENIKIKKYYPFADNKFTWVNAKGSYNANDPIHSSTYTISNPMVSQDFTLSLHPESTEFKSNLTMGPLTVHYLPKSLGPCFAQNNPSRLILWDREKAECYTPEERNISIQKAKSGNRFLVVKKEGSGIFSFFPDVSPWPVDKDMRMQRGSPLRIFSKKLFEDKPNLFLFGESTAYFEKEEKEWLYSKLDQNIPLTLPWMGFEIVLEKHQTAKVPTFIPEKVLPIQKNNEIIRGKVRALELEIQGNPYWVTNERPVQLLINGKKAVFYLQKETLKLPFEFVLTKFKMEKDPGTNRPASYESFVRLFSNDGPQEHHIYMNNPLKHQGFTFYQASYSQDQQGNYSSTLSVNVDPGRPFKYAGSLMLVFGSLWHYFLNFRKRKKKDITPLVAGTEEFTES